MSARPTPTSVFLLDQLAAATITAPGPGHVALQRMAIGRDGRSGLFQHPPSEVVFPPLVLGRRPVLHLGCGIKEVAWAGLQSAVLFEVTLTDAQSGSHPLWQLRLDPRNNPDHRRWRDARLDLRKFAGQAITLALTTRVAEGDDSRWCWSGWSDLRLDHETVPVSRPVRRDRHRHVLLITADALRADHLGCCGHPWVRTPNLDRLASAGCLVPQARTQSSATLASYASLLTGRNPLEHGILDEWGELPRGLPTLPELLAAHGYHTVMIHSEAELADPGTGFTSRFRAALPCVGVPAQEGAVTTRQFLRWLDGRPDQPFFAWLQFFDTHPPCTPPEPFRSLYYRRDPGKLSGAYRPDVISRIRGVEDLEEIIPGLAAFDKGQVDMALVRRLDATAAALTGQRAVGPDLVAHLRALGAPACRQMPPAAFGHWLADQARRLRRGELTPALREWFVQLIPQLLHIEADILSWLHGVRDFQYPLAQYQSQVTHLDHHVGTILDALKDQGLYDQTLIVFTSPHGESLTESAIHFHHHALLEAVLQVPLIVKPAQDHPGTQCKVGSRIDGIFDVIDLAPTVLEALGLPTAGNLTGTSRWRHLRDGTAIPAHSSLAVDMGGAMVALARPPFVYLRCDARAHHSSEWQWNPGDRGLYYLHNPVDYRANLVHALPEAAQQMERRLEGWLRWLGRRSANGRPSAAA